MNVERARRAARRRVVTVEPRQRRATVFEAPDPRWPKGAPNPYMRRETQR